MAKWKFYNALRADGCKIGEIAGKKQHFVPKRASDRCPKVAINVDPVFRTRGTQMLIYGNCFKQLPSLNNILLGLNIRLWNVI